MWIIIHCPRSRDGQGTVFKIPDGIITADARFYREKLPAAPAGGSPVGRLRTFGNINRVYSRNETAFRFIKAREYSTVRAGNSRRGGSRTDKVIRSHIAKSLSFKSLYISRNNRGFYFCIDKHFITYYLQAVGKRDGS